MIVTFSILGDRKGKRDLSFRKAGEYILGRAEEAHCQIDDGRVSKQHCRLIIQGLDARLRDLNSTNGTVVDGAVLGGTAKPHADGVPQPTVSEDHLYSARKEAPLKDGSVIQLGSTRLYVRIQMDEEDKDRIVRWMNDGERRILDAIELFGRVLEADPFNRRAKQLAEMLQAIREKMALEAKPSPADTQGGSGDPGHITDPAP